MLQVYRWSRNIHIGIKVLTDPEQYDPKENKIKRKDKYDTVLDLDIIKIM